MQNWNYSLNGKVAIKKLCEVTGKNKKTIQTYYKGLTAEIVVNKHNGLEVFKRLIEKNPLLKDLDDLMRYDFE